MALEIKQTLRLSQQLVMTPQLQQAIKLLQLNRLELAEVLRQEMLENPLLEDVQEQPEDGQVVERESDKTEEVKGEGEGTDEFDWESYVQSPPPTVPSNRGNVDPDLPSAEATYSRKMTLHDHLRWQLRMTKLPEDEEMIGEVIIGNIDDDGYLKTSCEEIAKEVGEDPELVEGILKRIQRFDPPGVGARDLRECLLLQCDQLGKSKLVRDIIDRHIPELEKRNYQAIAKSLKVSLNRVVEAVKEISAMEPKPGRPFYSDDAHYIIPDIYILRNEIRDENGELIRVEYPIVLNEDGLPKLRISRFYQRVLRQAGTGEKAKEYIQDRLRSAVWLIRSIHQRQRTIYKVTESIVKFQREFLEKGIEALRPMVLKDVADDIGMHESTVSRVTSNKYVHTPQGVFELKFFFNSSIRGTDGDNVASESVKQKIKDIVAREDPKRPYSDQEIVDILHSAGIKIARRTVAKYREALGILPSNKRKRLF